MLWIEGVPSAANGEEETEGEVAIGIEDDTRRTGDGYKIPTGRMSNLVKTITSRTRTGRC